MVHNKTMSDPENNMTAREWLESRMQDPRFAAMRARQEAEIAAAKVMFAADQRGMLAELAAAGEVVGSVYEFVNREAPPTAEAIVVLCKHLSVPHHVRIMDGIVRALTVPEARGEPAQQVLAALQRSTKREEEPVRWACLNALRVIGDRSIVEPLETMRSNGTLGVSDERMINAAMRACNKRKPLPG